MPPPRSRSPHCRVAQPAAGRVQHASPSEAGNAIHDGERPSLRPDARTPSEAGGNACLPSQCAMDGADVPLDGVPVPLPQERQKYAYFVHLYEVPDGRYNYKTLTQCN